jgi:hypothetical protein
VHTRTRGVEKKGLVARVEKGDACICGHLFALRWAIVCGSRGGRNCFRLAASGGALDDAVVLDVVGVVGLDVDGETVERTLKSVLGGRVHHAGLCGSC